MGHLITHKMRHGGIDVVQNPLVRPRSEEDEMGTDTSSSLLIRNGPEEQYWTFDDSKNGQ